MWKWTITDTPLVLLNEESLQYNNIYFYHSFVGIEFQVCRGKEVDRDATNVSEAAPLPTPEDKVYVNRC